MLLLSKTSSSWLGSGENYHLDSNAVLPYKLNPHFTLQAHSKTDWITSYNINHRKRGKLGYNLQIIDTPGFGDTRGFERDQELREHITKFFENKGGKGITHLNAVCFVTSASHARLTATQKYIFDSIISIFGKDIQNKIYVLATFADGRTPPVITALKDRVPYKTVLTFNNSALFANNKNDIATFSKMFWEMGKASFKEFFDCLTYEDEVSLQMSIDVLRKQKGIEIAIRSLSEQMKHLAELEIHMEIVQQQDMKLDTKVQVTKVQQILEKVEKGYATNCKTCKVTCHAEYSNWIDPTAFKYFCDVFSLRGNCISCPGKCSPSNHESSDRKYSQRQIKTYATKRELIDQYKDNSKVRNEKAGAVANIQGRIDIYQKSINACYRNHETS